jgi:hypothetical protein
VSHVLVSSALGRLEGETHRLAFCLALIVMEVAVRNLSRYSLHAQVGQNLGMFFTRCENFVTR